MRCFFQPLTSLQTKPPFFLAVDQGKIQKIIFHVDFHVLNAQLHITSSANQLLYNPRHKNKGEHHYSAHLVC